MTNFKPWLIAQLRRISYRWPPRNEAMKKARVDRGQYKCAKCKKVFHRSLIQLDHIKPVVDPKTGFTTWDKFIKRLFCGEDGFQVLCKDCHKKKTEKEDKTRG